MTKSPPKDWCDKDAWDRYFNAETPGSEALIFRAASESLRPLRRTGRCDLEVLRLVTDHWARTVPTMGRVLLFGRHPETPATRIRLGRLVPSGLVRDVAMGPQHPKRRHRRLE